MYTDYVEKLAKIYTTNGDFDKARGVFTAALAANDANIDIWEIYVYWSLENDYIGGKDEEKTKEVFEAARTRVGSHPQAWGIWKKYVDFELLRDNKNTINLIYYTALCSQVFAIDELVSEYTKFIDEHFDKLKDLITSENPAEFKEEKPNLLNHFLESNNDKATFLNIVNRLADMARAEVDKRLPFEGSLRALSYDVGNLANEQLAGEMGNWRNYIDMEKTEANYQKAAMLYKRMLIPYFDSLPAWKEYIEFASGYLGDIDRCREVFKYLRAHPIGDDKDTVLDIYLSNAHFEERQGQFKVARRLHKLINNVLAPNYIKVISEYVKFEQRINGPRKNILDFLEDSLEKAIKAEDEYAAIFLTVNTCRFHFATEQDLDLIFDIFSDSVKSFRSSKCLLLNFVKFLATIESTENKLYSRSFEIVEKATLDSKSTFELADKKQIAADYLAWLTSHCKEQMYIEIIANKFTMGGLTDGLDVPKDDVPALCSSADQPLEANATSHGTEDVPADPTQNDATAHAGDKRAAGEALNDEESHKRQKVDE